MHFHQLALALPLIALAIMAVLVMSLRRLLRIPATLEQGSNADDGEPDSWKRIQQRWGRTVTLVLPVPVGLATLAVATWLLAYVGWVATYFADRPTAMAGLPPWFGNVTLFCVNAIWGVGISIALVIVGIGIAVFAHAIGRALIWPTR